MFIDRTSYLRALQKQFQTHPIVALLGARQCGKTTLAKTFAKDVPHTFFDLEDPNDWQALQNPKWVLEPLQGLIVIDEIQRLPDIFPLFRVLADQQESRQFLILGSASRDLIKQSSETLAGRICYIDIHPFSFQEVDDQKKLHLRGGFPKAFLASSDERAFDWLEHYIRTFLERDIPALGFSIPSQTLRRFWSMLCHYHGCTFNASEIGRSLGLSDHTMRQYMDILCGTFMMRTLHPWFENIQKRQVKRPKIYFRDSGVFHQLLNIQTSEALTRHPKIGASWEGFALEHVARCLNIRVDECYYWGIQGKAELDLFLCSRRKRLGFEFKFSDAPRLTSSMIQARDLLSLDHLYIVTPGGKQYPLEDRIEALPFQHINMLSHP